MKNIVLNIDYSDEDRNEYRTILLAYTGIKGCKGKILVYFAFICLGISVLTGMWFSEITLLRYFNFILIPLIPILVNSYNIIEKQHKKKYKDKYPTIERVHQIVTVNTDQITMETKDSVYIYKKDWMKYLFIYNGNIAIASNDLDGIIFPKRYLDNTTKNEIIEIFNTLQKIEIS